MSDSLGVHGSYSTRLLCPWNSPGKITAVVAISFFRESYHPGSNPGLPAWHSPAFLNQVSTTQPFLTGTQLSSAMSTKRSISFRRQPPLQPLEERPPSPAEPGCVAGGAGTLRRRDVRPYAAEDWSAGEGGAGHVAGTDAFRKPLSAEQPGLRVLKLMLAWFCTSLCS